MVLDCFRASSKAVSSMARATRRAVFRMAAYCREQYTSNTRVPAKTRTAAPMTTRVTVARA